MTNTGEPFEERFRTARDMIPMEQVREITEQRKCYNHKRGCKFQTKWYYCTCCMMLNAIGTEFFDAYNKLRVADPDFAFSMTEWQRERFSDRYEYNKRWCDNYPRGASP